MPWPLLQIAEPPSEGDIDRYVIYVLLLAVIALFGWLMKKSGDAEAKSDKNAEKWEGTSKAATDELFEANRTISRAVDTLERQGALVEALARDLAAVRADGVEIRRVVTSLESDIRILREADRGGGRRAGGD